MKKYLLAFIAVGTIGIILHVLALFHILPPALTYSDVALFAQRAISPGWFYLDKNIEYSVRSGLFVQLMGWLVHGSKLLYVVFSSLALMGFGAGSNYLLWRMLPEDKKNNLWTYWIFAPSMFIFMTYNFDLLVLFEVILAFYLMKKDRPIAASIVLALGFCTKLYPIIYLLPFLIRLENPKKIWKSLGAFIATIVLINVYFIFANFDGWYYFYLFNSLRSYNLDSIWTVIMPWFRPWLYDIGILNIASFFSFMLVYIYILRKYRHVDLITTFLWVTILYAITSKVFSPQHILWLLPFFVLLGEPKKIWYYSLELVNTIIIIIVLYFNFIPHPSEHRLMLMMEPFTVIRFFILIIILYFSMRKYELPSTDKSDLKVDDRLSFVKKHPHIIAVIIFSLLSVFMTWPLVTRLTTAYPSTFQIIGGDPNIYVSYMDLVVKKFKGDLPVDLNKMVFYPDGVNLSGGYEAPIIFLVGAPVIIFTHNPILAYNIILLLAFILTSLACYFLILYLTKSFSIALICGFSFGFSSYMMVRGLQHLDLLFLFSVPLLVLATLKFLDQPHYKNIFYLALSVLLAALSAWYYLFAGLIFIVIAFLANIDKFVRPKKLFVYAALAVALSVLLPTLPIILNKTSEITKNADVVVGRAGAQPLSFILPHPFSVVFGWMTDGIYKHFPSVYQEPYPYFEQTSYFGLIGLIAVVVLIFYRKKVPIPNRALWVSTFLVFMLLALGNFIKIGQWEIIMPFKALHQIFPFDHMRAPNRFFVFSYLAVTVIFV